MKMLFCRRIVALILLTVALQAITLSSAQRTSSSSPSSSCTSMLSPCLRYVNGNGKVGRDCCEPLKQVIREKPECICRMISNRGSRQAEQAGIDLSQAQMLPARCGQRINPFGCLESSEGSNRSSNGGRLPSRAGGMKVVALLLIGAPFLWIA